MNNNNNNDDDKKPSDWMVHQILGRSRSPSSSGNHTILLNQIRARDWAAVQLHLALFPWPMILEEEDRTDSAQQQQRRTLLHWAIVYRAPVALLHQWVWTAGRAVHTQPDRQGWLPIHYMIVYYGHYEDLVLDGLRRGGEYCLQYTHPVSVLMLLCRHGGSKRLFQYVLDRVNDAQVFGNGGPHGTAITPADVLYESVSKRRRLGLPTTGKRGDDDELLDGLHLFLKKYDDDEANHDDRNTNKKQQTPQHHSLHKVLVFSKHATRNPRTDYVTEYLRQYPHSIRELQPGTGRLPLHTALKLHQSSFAQLLLTRHPDAARHPDVHSRLPVHYSVSWNAPLTLLLLDHFPEILQTDGLLLACLAMERPQLRFHLLRSAPQLLSVGASSSSTQ